MTTALLMHVSRPQRDVPSRVGIIMPLASLAVWGACSISSDIPQICVHARAQSRALKSRLLSLTREDFRCLFSLAVWTSGLLHACIIVSNSGCRSSKDCLDHAAKHRRCLPHSRIVSVAEPLVYRCRSICCSLNNVPRSCCAYAYAGVLRFARISFRRALFVRCKTLINGIT
jgi:hypothetical protein